MRRKLAAILAADVVGFSRLMGDDEVGTFVAVQDLFTKHLQPCIAARGGRVVKTMGDAILAVFESSVEAVACAHDMQQLVAKLASGGKGLRLRVGVNAGDVIFQDDDIFGDSVNIAARLQTLGQPGDIVVSGEVFRAVRRKLPIIFESRGFQTLKNIAEKVEVHVAMADPGPDGALSHGAAPTGASSQPQAAQGHTSIIVLPFANLSRDPEQEYFCDGLTQDITTDLSKFANLFVFAANSAFTYKGRVVRPSQLSRELGVQYLLEGSVQKAQTKVRINAQLIETSSERHLWADRLDRPLDDLLMAQEELVRRIVVILAVRVTASEMERVTRRETEDINAYDCFLHGAHLYLSQIDRSAESEEGLLQAKAWFERATRIDPSYARAWGWLAYTHMNRFLEGWAGPEASTLAEELAKRAVGLNPEDHDTHWALGFVYANSRRPELGLGEFEQAFALNPNDANMLAEMAETLTALGRHQDAVTQVRHAMALNPHFPEWYRWVLGWVLHHAQDYAGSNAELQRILKPNNEVRLIMAANCARLGDKDQAAALLLDFRQRRADWTLAQERRTLSFRRPEDEAHWLESLRLAGLGEK